LLGREADEAAAVAERPVEAGRSLEPVPVAGRDQRRDEAARIGR
jgi:hypothetical protein